MTKYPIKIEHIILLLLLLASCNTPPSPIDVNSLLVRNRISDVESYFDRVQSQFESGEMNEIQFRDEFRAFYVLDDEAVNNLSEWAMRTPDSHISHLGLGIFLKREGRGARSYNYIRETPLGRLLATRDYMDAARDELTIAMALTAKPYMEVFHLLDIAGFAGDNEAMDELIQTANSLLPDNALSRMRRANFLLPRWGGSYEEFDRFYEASRAEGVPELSLRHMEAIKYQDLASTVKDEGNLPLAYEYYELALLLGEEIGGTFNADNLYNSWLFVCYPRNLVSSHCQEPSDYN